MEVVLKREWRLRVGRRYCRAISPSLVLHRDGLPALRLIHVPVSESHIRRDSAAYLEGYGHGLAWLEGAQRGVRTRELRTRGVSRSACHRFFEAALHFRFGVESG